MSSHGAPLRAAPFAMPQGPGSWTGAGASQLRFRGLETAFVLVSLFLFSNALIGPVFAPDQTTSDDLVWLRYLWLPIYAGAALFSVLRGRRLAPMNPAWLVFALLIAWVAASANWSIAQDVTNRRTFALAATTLFGIYLASSFRRGAFVVLTAWCLIALAVGSVLAAVLDPALGVHSDINAGDWRGLWYQKNALGGMMAFGVFTCLSAYLITGRRWPWWPGGALCLMLVLLSRSQTGLLCTLAPLAAYVVVWASRRSGSLAVAIVFVAGTQGGAVAALLWLAPDLVFASLGKDPTLTGRTDIWAALFRQLAKQPLLGYGYGAFWLPDSVPANWVRAETHWLVPSAHNGWLDVLIQIGWIGGALTGLVIAVVAVAALVRGWRLDDGCWSLFFVLAFVIRSFSESVLISENSFDWMMFAAAAATLLMRPPRDETAPATRVVRAPPLG